MFDVLWKIINLIAMMAMTWLPVVLGSLQRTGDNVTENKLTINLLHKSHATNIDNIDKHHSG